MEEAVANGMQGRAGRVTMAKEGETPGFRATWETAGRQARRCMWGSAVAKVGDRVEVRSGAQLRTGIVVGLAGTLLRVRWDTGDETSITPAPGALWA